MRSTTVKEYISRNGEQITARKLVGNADRFIEISEKALAHLVVKYEGMGYTMENVDAELAENLEKWDWDWDFMLAIAQNDKESEITRLFATVGLSDDKTISRKLNGYWTGDNI